MITISPDSAPGSSHSVSLSRDAGNLIARGKFAAAANAPDRQFPATFAWGVATAAPQIEGASTLDGKGPSVWDKFCREPGKVFNGDTLDVACEHYTRFKDDFAMMAGMGLKHYRFSLAWPRFFPAGRGKLNPKGIEFYDRLIDAMLAEGIKPWVTMFHWDLPQPLEDEGGWRVRGVVDAFSTYADTIVRAYGDRVKDWITLNEIYCFTRLGYGVGEKAPGAMEGEVVVNQTYHHALLCHGEGVRAVRQHGGDGARVGLTDNSYIPVPVTETDANIGAARQIFVRENNRILDPIFSGAYSAEYLAATGPDAPQFETADFDLISQPLDFVGLNVYTGYFVRADEAGEPEALEYPASYPEADSPWLKLNPRAMYWGPRLLAEVYGVQNICITENGAGYDDGPPENGKVLDLHRLEYVRSCLVELKRAIDDGVPVTGYFLWSLLDNFEWQDGYNRRFGITYVDFETQERTPKLSADWYSAVVEANRLL
jgi:beta-glucosidase